MVALLVTALVALALLAYVGVEWTRSVLARRQAGEPVRRPAPRIDPGVERRAERRARTLLRSIVDAEDWELYRDLGFLRVAGRMAHSGSGSYCYLIYPHRPIVAYLPESNSLLSEYCVEFPDRGDGKYGPKLPDSDDVLAKWMMIKADEERLVRGANMHLPGRQVDPAQVRRDLSRLRDWDRKKAADAKRPPVGPAAVARTA